MPWKVVVSRTAARDIDRLEAWLLDKNPGAAVKVRGILQAAFEGTVQFPRRGRIVRGAIRQTYAPFGKSAYVIRYRFQNGQVIITRIFHGKERR